MNLPFSVDVVLVAVVVAAHVDTRLAPSSTGHSSCLRRDRPQQLSGAPIFTPFFTLCCCAFSPKPNIVQSIKTWVDEIDRNADKHVNKILIGNKCDVDESMRVS